MTNQVQQSNPNSPYMSEPDAAKYVNVCLRTLWGLRKSGHIPHYRIGRLVRYRADDLDQWLASRRLGGDK